MPTPRKQQPVVTYKQIVNSPDDFDDTTIAQILMQSSAIQGAIESGARSDTVERLYPANPVEFMTKTLGYQMWDKLEEICLSVRDNHNTVVESGFGLGKSISAASLACWYMTVMKPAIVILIAPSWSQVQNVVFRYIRATGRAANLPGRILDSPRWEISADHYAVGLSPRKSSAEDVATIQGFHGPNVLVIMDEAAGLPRIIWDTVNGLTVGENCRILAIGNPIEQAGPFWDACNSSNWSHIRISCLEHPNVVSGKEDIPGAVSRTWVDERCQDWATKVDANTPGAVHIPWNDKYFLPTPIFTAKVLGIAPEQAESQLISLRWVLDAQQNEIIDANASDVVIGLDVARTGDDYSTMVTRRGNKIIHIERKHLPDTQLVASWLANEMLKYDGAVCYVDEIGLGAGALDRARALGLRVIGVMSSRAALQRRRFANLRAEMWWRVRDLLQEGKLDLPDDALLTGDLVAPRYSWDNYGRIIIEDKDEIRKRIKRSPDTADALCLTYAQPVVDVDQVIISRLRGLGNTTGEIVQTTSPQRWLVGGHGRFSKGSRWKR